MKHLITLTPQEYEGIVQGDTTSILRKEGARNYTLRDTLIFQEAEDGVYTGKEREALIGYIYRGVKGLMKDWVVLNFKAEPEPLAAINPSLDMTAPSAAQNDEIPY